MLNQCGLTEKVRSRLFDISSDKNYSSQYGKRFKNYRVAKGVRDTTKLYTKNEAALTELYGEEEYSKGLNKLGQWYGNVKYSKRVIDGSRWVKEDPAIRNAWAQGYDGRKVKVDVFDFFADGHNPLKGRVGRKQISWAPDRIDYLEATYHGDYVSNFAWW